MKKTSCAIMFADVSGSTQLYDRMGDEVAKNAIDHCLGHLQAVTETNQGVVIKKIGDELMCRFETAEHGICAAKAAQIETTNLLALDNIKLSIRIGLHFGQVIEDDNDIFGDAVNVAARMAGIAKGGQIITTAETFAALPDELTAQVRQIDLTHVKGKEEMLEVYEVMWEQSGDFTRVATQLFSRAKLKPVKLKLTFGSNVVELNSSSKAITVGRDESCDFVVNTGLASRKHATFEFRRGKFILTDQGTNGTYASFSGKEEIYLRREELVLQGTGLISLGQSIDETDAENLIEFASS